VPEVLEDPQVVARQMVRRVPHPLGVEVPLVSSPMRFADAPLRPRVAPPLLGQHSDDVLQGLGYTDNDIQALRANGVI
jgi:crotonobetainyl-CoA:carnitine CoA-transferase CaiB-like acyl-CoA transferase